MGYYTRTDPTNARCCLLDYGYCFITPVSIANLFVKAEREGDWLFLMYCVWRMLTCFFAAGQWEYSGYVTWHIIDIVKVTENPPAIFGMIQHVYRDVIWNGVFSDQFGKPIYYGKSKGVLVGMTLLIDQVSGQVIIIYIGNYESWTVNKSNVELYFFKEKWLDIFRSHIQQDVLPTRLMLDDINDYIIHQTKLSSTGKKLNADK